MSALMGQPKPFASLSSGLLARKGQAKPAMRPQGFSGFGAVTEAIDDLGWNDMGHAEAQPNSAVAAAVSPVPPVLRERQVLREEVEAPAVLLDAVPVAPRAAAAKAKAAFTLRLDADRHFRLRLASALSNRSSQQLVTQALDVFLQSLPEVEAMAVRLSQRADVDLGDGG